MLVLVLVVVLLPFCPHAYIRARGNALVDEYGRQRIFHGVNVVVKTAPYLPVTIGPFNTNNTLVDADYAFLARYGFNMIRLGVMWPGVTPTPPTPQHPNNNINATYLSAIAAIVNNARAHGIYSLLDLHQDLFARRYCGEGAPDWALSNEGGLASFPLPRKHGFTKDDMVFVC
jgi:endoglycosylceramidase